VIDGVLQAKGMASFKETLQAEDVQAVRAYLISRAHAAKSALR
jgi:hypothetical protein